jgi:uncharacterized protein involved in cysteine biosynthesis
MSAVPAAFVKAAGQLGDRRVLVVLGKSVAITLALFAAGGWALYLALAEVAGKVGIDAGWAGVLAVLLVPVAIWLLFRIVALAVLQFFADGIVAAVEARHYPARAAEAQALPFRREIGIAARGLARALGYNLLALPVAGMLAFTAIGPALVFLAVNAVLLGRELTEMAWLRHCRGDESGNPAPRTERFLLGAGIAALMLVPLVNFLAPVLGAAAGTHLVLRRLDKQEARA